MRSLFKRRRRFASLFRKSNSSAVRNRARRLGMSFEPLEVRSLLAADLLAAYADDASPLGDQAYTATAASQASITSASATAAEGEDAPDLVAFAQALTASGAKYYGAPWCSFCTEQKQLFGDGGAYLPYINVSNPDRTLNEAGQSANISTFPTWDFADGTRVTGLQTLQQLSTLSGVAIPTSSEPSIKPIADTTLLIGAPLHVALDGYDPNGDALTYTVTSDNPLVTPTVLSGNRSMRIDVQGWGEMVFELFEDKAPRPTGRVIELAQSGFYDGIIFHRVIDNFVIQAGDPTGTGSGGSPLPNFDDQFHVDLQHVTKGVLSYAKSGDDTNDSQFFVTLAPTRHLDFNHSIFGQLVEGQAVLEAIGKTQTTTGDRPAVDVTINTIEIFSDTENAMVMLRAAAGAAGQTANITVTVSDGTGNTAQETFAVTVAADTSNGGPFLKDLPDFTTPINTPLEIQLEAVDVEGDPVYYDANSVGSVNYTLDVNHDTGLVRVTPPTGFVGQFEVMVGVRPVTTSNTTDTWDQQRVTVTVEAAGSQNPAAPEVELLADSDSGTQGDNVTNETELTFRVTNVASGATVRLLNNGTVIGQGTATGTSIEITTNSLAALGDGQYTITATQTVGEQTSEASDPLQVTLDTTPPPAFTSTPPTTATNGSALVYDAENPEEGTAGFRYSLVGAPAGATINATTGLLNWTPTNAQGGAHSFQIAATDLAGNSTSQNLNITVTVVEQQVLIELVVTDADENPITTISVGQEFFVWAYVQDLRSAGQGVFAAYMDINYDPDLVSLEASTLGQVTFGDKYQNGKSGILTTPGLIDEIGAFGPTTPTGSGKELLFVLPFTASESGQIVFQPSPADGAGREVLVFGSNAEVPWNAVTFTPAILAVGSGVTATDDLFNVDEDTQNFELDVLANDVNLGGGTLTITETGSTSQQGTVTIASGGQRLLYTPAADFFGEETFTYTISNGQQTSTATVTVQVAPVNDPPTAVNDTATVNRGSQQNFLDVLANDLIAPDQNETLRITAVGTTNNGGTVTIAPNGTHLLYTPAANFSGTETFTYTIRDRASSDATGLTSTATVTVTVSAVGAPAAQADTATVEEDSSGNVIDVLANDTPSQAGRALTIVGVSQGAKGGTVTIAQNGTRVQYTPATDFFGTDTFTYTVKEADGGQTTASVTVTVTGKNDPPKANNDTFSVTKGSSGTTLDVLDNDSILPDADEILIVSAVTQGSQGGTITISSDAKSVRYTPAAGFEGTETFTYTIRDREVGDAAGLTSTATVTVNVRAYVARDIGGKMLFSSGLKGIGGIDVTLEGVDDFNGTVTPRTAKTLGDGSFVFEDLAPGNYTVTRTQAVFLDLKDNKLTIDSNGEDGDSTNNNFSQASRDAGYVSIADFLARAPGQSSISAANSLLIAAQNGANQHWYSYLAGWEGYSQLEAALSSDGATLTLTGVTANGQQVRGTVSTTASFVKLLGTSGTSRLLRIDAGPEQIGMQPVSTTPVVTVNKLTTNDTTPLITGTVSTGTLQVVVNNRTYTAGDGNLSVSGTNWSLQIPNAHALTAGTYNVTASATGSTGTVGTDSTSNELVIDTTAPTVTVNTQTTSDTTPVITGTVSDGTLQVVVNNRTYKPGDGNLTVTGTTWSLQIPAAHTLAQGTYSVTASATDAAGNTGTDTTSNELVISSTAAPTVTVNPLTTNDTTPAITGTVSGGTLEVIVNGRTYTAGDGNLTVTGTNWSLQIPAAHTLSQGTYSVTARSQNTAGAVGTDTTNNELVIDTTAPTVTVTTLTTADTTPLIGGTVSDGTLTVVVNNRTYTAGDGNLTVTGTNWQLQIPTAHALTQGTYSVTASSTDAAGNVGTDATSNELVIDPTAPPVVTVTPLTTNDTTPVITGTVSDGTLQVVVNSRTYTPGDGNLTVTGNTWSLQIPAGHALTEGTYSVTASATSSQGAGTDTTNNELVIDTTEPVVTVSSLTTNDTTPVITGTVSDGTLQVVVNGRTYTTGDGNLTVSGTTWSLQIPAGHVLTPGTYSVTASATDAAGNVGTDATSNELVISAAATPTVTVNPLTTNDTTPAITGTVSNGTLQVQVNGQTYTAGDGNLTVSGTNWTLQIPASAALSDGTYDVTASATGDGNQVGTDATDDELVIDTVAPEVTVTPLTTSDPTPVISGTVSDGTLQVQVNGQTYTVGDGNLTVSGTNWTLQIPAAQALSEGTYSVTASATDAAGNVGSDTTSDELVIDTTTPAVTVDTLTTNDPTPLITGTVSDGTLQVQVNGQTYTAGDGNLTVTGTQWSLQIPAAAALADGTYDVVATATDAQDNTGTDSTTDELVIDTEAPVVTVDALSTNDTTPLITGTVSEGTLQVQVNGQTYTAGDGNLTVTGSEWSLQIPAADVLAAGTYEVLASATDAAGNVGTDFTSNELVIEAASAPVVTVDALTTNDTTPLITGTVSGGTLQVQVNGQTYTAGDGNLVVSGTNWSLQIPAADALEEGTYDVTASATGEDQQVGTDATSDELVIDTTAPAVTVDPHNTSETSPSITGTVSDGVLQVIVGGQTYTAGDGALTVTGTQWSLQIPEADALAVGTYDVVASATDSAGNIGTDSTSDELIISSGEGGEGEAADAVWALEGALGDGPLGLDWAGAADAERYAAAVDALLADGSV